MNTCNTFNMALSVNPLYTWLKSKQFWLYKQHQTSDQQCEISHTLLDGGKIKVPADFAAEFNTRYAEALLICPQYMVELKTPIFKMFMDIDFKVRSSDCMLPTDDVLLKLSQYIYNTCYLEWLKQNPGVSASEAVIELRTCTSGTQDTVKAGMHIIWDTWHVDQQIATSFSTFCASLCRSGFTEFTLPAGTLWNNVIDPSVYKGSGLRMTGSRKVGSTSVYIPRAVVDCHGVLHLVQNPWSKIHAWVSRTSIRVVCGLKQQEAAEMSMFLRPSLTTRGLKDSDENSIVQQRHGKNLVHVPLSKIHDYIMELRTMLPAMYKNVKFTNVYVTNKSSKKSRVTFVIGTTSKYCLNKCDGYHNSNHIYFTFNSEGVFQRCFCECETTVGRKLKMCKDFVKKLLPTTGVIKDIFLNMLEQTN